MLLWLYLVLAAWLYVISISAIPTQQELDEAVEIMTNQLLTQNQPESPVPFAAIPELPNLTLRKVVQEFLHHFGDASTESLLEECEFLFYFSETSKLHLPKLVQFTQSILENKHMDAVQSLNEVYQQHPSIFLRNSKAHDSTQSAIFELAKANQFDLMSRLKISVQLTYQRTEVYVMYTVQDTGANGYQQWVADVMALKFVCPQVKIVAMVDENMVPAPQNFLLGWLAWTTRTAESMEAAQRLLLLLCLDTSEKVVQAILKIAEFPRPFALRLIHVISRDKSFLSFDDLKLVESKLAEDAMTRADRGFLADVLLSNVWANPNFFHLEHDFIFKCKDSVFEAAVKSLTDAKRLQLCKTMIKRRDLLHRFHLIIPVINTSPQEWTQLLLLASAHYRPDIFAAMMINIDRASQGQNWEPSTYWRQIQPILLEIDPLLDCAAFVFWNFENQLGMNPDKWFLSMPLSLQWKFIQRAGVNNAQKIQAIRHRTREPVFKNALILKLKACTEVNFSAQYLAAIHSAWR